MTIACERFDAAAKQILRARWRRDVDGALVCRWVPERAIPTRGQSGRDERLTPIPATKSRLTTLDSDAEADRVAEQHSYASHLPPARLSGLPGLHRPDPEADLGTAVVVRQLQLLEQ
jgi:hypothetical protein